MISQANSLATHANGTEIQVFSFQLLSEMIDMDKELEKTQENAPSLVDHFIPWTLWISKIFLPASVNASLERLYRPNMASEKIKLMTSMEKWWAQKWIDGMRMREIIRGNERDNLWWLIKGRDETLFDTHPQPNKKSTPSLHKPGPTNTNSTLLETLNPLLDSTKFYPFLSLYFQLVSMRTTTYQEHLQSNKWKTHEVRNSIRKKRVSRRGHMIRQLEGGAIKTV